MMKRGGSVRLREKAPSRLTEKQQVKALGRKDGGSVPGGMSSKANLDAWSRYASKHTKYAQGGHVYPKMKAGMDSGPGRLQLTKEQKKRR